MRPRSVLTRALIAGSAIALTSGVSANSASGAPTCTTSQYGWQGFSKIHFYQPIFEPGVYIPAPGVGETLTVRSVDYVTYDGYVENNVPTRADQNQPYEQFAVKIGTTDIASLSPDLPDSVAEGAAGPNFSGEHPGQLAGWAGVAIDGGVVQARHGSLYGLADPTTSSLTVGAINVTVDLCSDSGTAPVAAAAPQVATAPVTAAPVTAAPVTAAPVFAAPATAAPATAAPATAPPFATVPPTTVQPTVAAPPAPPANPQPVAAASPARIESAPATFPDRGSNQVAAPVAATAEPEPEPAAVVAPVPVAAVDPFAAAQPTVVAPAPPPISVQPVDLSAALDLSRLTEAQRHQAEVENNAQVERQVLADSERKSSSASFVDASGAVGASTKMLTIGSLGALVLGVGCVTLGATGRRSDNELCPVTIF